MTEGYIQKNYGKLIKRYVQTMDLKDDEELIRRYCEAHDEIHARPEVLAGMREVGILEMELYRLGNRVIMIVDAPEDFDWTAAMTHLATLPGQEDWETFVSQFQQCNPTDTSDQKWKMMERIFRIYDK
ncbi:MAG: L-rhamnose mutarotase [Bacteroidales bacterium]|nr:L-rhamnose mutarotase [Bacteroidales bacterium]MCM1146315.1 L-rhamnose mutarotase [Bacteroidales bacterium]MCM1205247.1 L-rhamnose mutarotase [Bacillota bacterium]MCM1509668.1 L-rhamnose mutarotase [Clostridium sp.]